MSEGSPKEQRGENSYAHEGFRLAQRTRLCPLQLLRSAVNAGACVSIRIKAGPFPLQEELHETDIALRVRHFLQALLVLTLDLHHYIQHHLLLEQHLVSYTSNANMRV